MDLKLELLLVQEELISRHDRAMRLGGIDPARCTEERLRALEFAMERLLLVVENLVDRLDTPLPPPPPVMLPGWGHEDPHWIDE